MIFFEVLCTSHLLLNSLLSFPSAWVETDFGQVNCSFDLLMLANSYWLLEILTGPSHCLVKTQTSPIKKPGSVQKDDSSSMHHEATLFGQTCNISG